MSEKDSEYEAAFKEEVAKEKKSAAMKSKAAAVPPLPSAPVASVAAPASSYVVTETKLISWHGHLTQMRKGKVVSEAVVGKGGIAHLLEQGVKLEPVK